MTTGEQIAAYYCKGESPSQVARRIDAALAEERERCICELQELGFGTAAFMLGKGARHE